MTAMHYNRGMKSGKHFPGVTVALDCYMDPASPTEISLLSFTKFQPLLGIPKLHTSIKFCSADMQYIN